MAEGNPEECYIDLRIVLKKKQDEWEEDYEYYTPVRVERGPGTTASEEVCDSMAESAGQSDFWQVDIHNALFSALEGDVTYFKERE